MFPDARNLFCDKQKVTATAASTNVIDLGPAQGTVGRNLNPAVKVFAQVVTGADTTTDSSLTSIACALQGSNAENFASPVVVANSGAVAAANLVQGLQMLKNVPYLVDEAFRYYRLYFTVVGTATSGIEVTGGILKDGVDHITTAY